MDRLRHWFLPALLLPILFLSASVPARAAPAGVTLIVNDAGDSDCSFGCPVCDGTMGCTLRQALGEASLLAGHFNHIRFDFSTDANTSTYIFPQTRLTPITNQGTWIDGSNAAGVPVNVVIDAQLITSPGSPLFEVDASDVTLSNLSIQDSAAIGDSNPFNQLIWVAAGQDARVAFNYLGYDKLNQVCPTSSHAEQALFIDSSDGASGPGQGTVYVYGNTISCMTQVGVLAMTPYAYIGMDADGNPSGNYIGTLPADKGTRNHAGVIVGSSSNVSFNTIVRNTTTGVLLDGASVSGNKVQGNTIRRQGGPGVEIINGANSNLIGWDGVHGASTLGNVISGNVGDGVYIGGSATTANVVAGNKIGTDATGLVGDGNSLRGVLINDNANGNYIGAGSGFFAAAAAPEIVSALSAGGNIISNNGGDGVQINNGARANTIAGNWIGTNSNATGVMANASNGVALLGGAQYNVVGGNSAFRGNLIAGNEGDGVYIGGGTTSTNTLGVNTIGLLGIPNGGNGIRLAANTHANIIGVNSGALRSNNVSSNQHSGIYVSDGANRNRIYHNISQRNNLYGVLFDGNTTVFNSVEDDIIFLNQADGIGERNSANSNTWSNLAVYGNFGLGIDKLANFGDGANLLDLPLISFTSVDPSTGVVTGRGRPSGFGSTTIELYRVLFQSSAFGQGYQYVGSSSTDGSGIWSITDAKPSLSSGCYVAFETNAIFLTTTSSEFSLSSCSLFLPSIRR